MSTDWKALCEELAHEVEQYAEDRGDLMPECAERARAALAQPEPEVVEPTDGPAVPEGREPAAVTGEPSDEELLSIAADCFAPVIVHYARAVLARYGHQPAPPAAGEVGELAVFLRGCAEDHYGQGRRQFTRAADLLEQRHPAPVPVAERYPEPNTKVLAHYFNALGKGRTICAIWVPAKSRSDDADYADRDFTEYDEEDDKFYWPEGWYEAIENWDDLGWVKVDEGEVVYWQPLPKWPALPLPQPAEEMQP